MSERDIRLNLHSREFPCRDCGQMVRMGRRLGPQGKRGALQVGNLDGSLHYITCPNHTPRKRKTHFTGIRGGVLDTGIIIGICLDCGNRCKTFVKEWERATRPKCTSCGGLLRKSDNAADVQASRQEAAERTRQTRGKHRIKAKTGKRNTIQVTPAKITLCPICKREFIDIERHIRRNSKCRIALMT